MKTINSNVLGNVAGGTPATARGTRALPEFLPVAPFWRTKPASRRRERDIITGIIIGSGLSVAVAWLISLL